MDSIGDLKVIARMWRGEVSTNKAKEYRSFLNRQALPDYGAIDGNRGVYIFERQEGEQTHFEILSLWSGEDALTKFAGDNWEQAKYYEEEKTFLEIFEPMAKHYRVVGKSWW